MKNDKTKLFGAIKCALFVGIGFYVGGPIGALVGLIAALAQTD